MAKHNFKALQTFRAWSKENNEWMYGSYIKSYEDLIVEDNQIIVYKDLFGNEIVDYSDFFVVEKESIGIYTGKNDATKWEDRPEWLKHILKEDWTGVPIFAGLPEDGNIGGDKVSDGHGNSGYVVFDDEMMPCIDFTDVELVSLYDSNSWSEVIGTAYEQHLKETK